MSLLAWSMMGISLWHFTVYLPDKFWGGIIGAFFASLIGAVVIGIVVNGFSIPGIDDTGIEQAFIAIPGAIAGLAACYFYGAAREEAEEL